MPRLKKPIPQIDEDLPYDRETEKILKAHGADDLSNEIGLVRYMNLVTLKKMNVHRNKLSYHDYLSTLRAITFSSGMVARLINTQYRIFQPLAEMENRYKAEMDGTYESLFEFAKKLMGEDRVAEIEWEALKSALDGKDGKPTS